MCAHKIFHRVFFFLQMSLISNVKSLLVFLVALYQLLTCLLNVYGGYSPGYWCEHQPMKTHNSWLENRATFKVNSHSIDRRRPTTTNTLSTFIRLVCYPCRFRLALVNTCFVGSWNVWKVLYCNLGDCLHWQSLSEECEFAFRTVFEHII